MSKWMMKYGTALAALILSIGPAFADGTGGCVDSPENPTLLLALLGGVAASASRVRSFLRSRSRRQD